MKNAWKSEHEDSKEIDGTTSDGVSQLIANTITSREREREREWKRKRRRDYSSKSRAVDNN